MKNDKSNETNSPILGAPCSAGISILVAQGSGVARGVLEGLVLLIGPWIVALKQSHNDIMTLWDNLMAQS